METCSSRDADRTGSHQLLGSVIPAEGDRGGLRSRSETSRVDANMRGGALELSDNGVGTELGGAETADAGDARRGVRSSSGHHTGKWNAPSTVRAQVG